MLLWVMSDIHLELTRGWDLPAPSERPDFDVLVVAGDLVTKMERGVKWLLDRVPDKPCCYVAGNHEAYGQDIDRTVEKALAAADGTNVHVLQDRAGGGRDEAKRMIAGAGLASGPPCYRPIATSVPRRP